MTGRETRRTGPIKSSGAARNEVRFREMRVGSYQLEFKRDKKTLDEALSLRPIKAKRSSAVKLRRTPFLARPARG